MKILTVPVTVTDDNGATDTTEIQITLTGTNDAPVVGRRKFHGRWMKVLPRLAVSALQ